MVLRIVWTGRNVFLDPTGLGHEVRALSQRNVVRNFTYHVFRQRLLSHGLINVIINLSIVDNVWRLNSSFAVFSWHDFRQPFIHWKVKRVVIAILLLEANGCSGVWFNLTALVDNTLLHLLQLLLHSQHLLTLSLLVVLDVACDHLVSDVGQRALLNFVWWHYFHLFHLALAHVWLQELAQFGGLVCVLRCFRFWDLKSRRRNAWNIMSLQPCIVFNKTAIRLLPLESITLFWRILNHSSSLKLIKVLLSCLFRKRESCIPLILNLKVFTQIFHGLWLAFFAYSLVIITCWVEVMFRWWRKSSILGLVNGIWSSLCLHKQFLIHKCGVLEVVILRHLLLVCLMLLNSSFVLVDSFSRLSRGWSSGEGAFEISPFSLATILVSFACILSDIDVVVLARLGRLLRLW